jgi:hypothetical protein
MFVSRSSPCLTCTTKRCRQCDHGRNCDRILYLLLDGVPLDGSLQGVARRPSMRNVFGNVDKGRL